MSIGAWIFLSVLALIVVPVLLSGTIFFFGWRKAKKFVRDLKREFEKKE